jgi:sugar phosphate permease
MLLMSFVQEVWQYWALYAAIGALGLAEFAGLASQAAVSNWFIYRRGRALMLSTLGNTTGTIVGAPVVAFILTMVGWRQAWSVMGILLLVVLVPLILIFIHNRPEDVGLTPDGGWKPTGAAAQRAAAQITDESWTLGEALRTRELWALIGVFVFGGSTISLNVTLAPYLDQEYGLTAQDVGWIISAFWIPASISRIIWGTLVDILPARVCLLAVTVFRATGPFCLAFTPYPFNLGLWMFFSGLLGNAYGILQPVMFGNYFGRRSFATIQGGVRPFMALPTLAVPLVIAGLADYTGHFTAGFIFSGCVGMLGAACAFFAGPPRKAKPAGTATRAGV